MNKAISSLLAFVLSLVVQPTFGVEAEEDPINALVPNIKREIQSTEEISEGWSPKLELSANLSLGSSQDVVGQTDGDTKTYGLNVTGGANYRDIRQEWRSVLKLAQATSKSPAISQYVKSQDQILVDSIYLYSLESVPWLGPYVKAGVQTSLFKGEDIRERVYTYSVKGSNEVLHTGETLRLTDSLRPIATKQSVGAFAKLIDRKKTQLELRLGLGLIQV